VSCFYLTLIHFMKVPKCPPCFRDDSGAAVAVRLNYLWANERPTTRDVPLRPITLAFVMSTAPPAPSLLLDGCLLNSCQFFIAKRSRNRPAKFFGCFDPIHNRFLCIPERLLRGSPVHHQAGKLFHASNPSLFVVAEDQNNGIVLFAHSGGSWLRAVAVMIKLRSCFT
jgi:hypothetical protein